MKYFDKVPISVTNRSKERLDCFHETTTDFGRLDVPYWTDMVEGEDFTFSIEKSFFDAAPMVVPTRGRIFMNIRCFFVPNRILCDKVNFDWNLWRTDLSNNAHPYVSESDLINQYISGSPLGAEEKIDLRRLYSQLRLSARTFNSVSGESYQHPERLNPFPFYAYNRIWWDFYRDSNLIDDSQINNYVPKLSAGVQSFSWFRPRYCCFGKDYFTTAKLNPQEGSSNVGSRVASFDGQNVSNGPNPNNVISSDDSILGNTSNNISSIQWLRASNAYQRLKELYNIVGGRVAPRFFARFGQTPDNIRLDQAEYIGGTSYLMSVGGVTSPLQSGSAGSPLNPFIDTSVSMAGQRAGRGVIEGSLPPIHYHAKEHGIFMVIATLVPEIGYYQGLHKQWQRGVDNDKEGYLCPEYDCFGYEPIFNKELALCNLEEDSTNSALWGFSRRYGSYCYMNNCVSGDLVLKETQTGMEAFHLLRDFRNSNGVIYAPALNANFTMIVPAMRKQFDRIFQVIGTSGQYDHFVGYHECRGVAILPKSPNSEPSLEEHGGKRVQVDNGGTRF